MSSSPITDTPPDPSELFEDEESLSPAGTTTALCALVTGVDLAVRYTSDLGHEWTIHIAVAAITIALTVTVIDRVIRAQEERRHAKTAGVITSFISIDFDRFCACVRRDVMEEEAAESVPTDALTVLEWWMDHAIPLYKASAFMVPEQRIARLSRALRSFSLVLFERQQLAGEALVDDLRAAILPVIVTAGLTTTWGDDNRYPLQFSALVIGMQGVVRLGVVLKGLDEEDPHHIGPEMEDYLHRGPIWRAYSNDADGDSTPVVPPVASGRLCSAVTRALLRAQAR